MVRRRAHADERRYLCEGQLNGSLKLVVYLETEPGSKSPGQMGSLVRLHVHGQTGLTQLAEVRRLGNDDQQ